MKIFKELRAAIESSLKYLSGSPFENRARAEKSIRVAIYIAQENNISKFTVDEIWSDLYQKRADEAFKRLEKKALSNQEP